MNTTTKKEEFSVNYDELLREILTEEGTISKCYSLFHNYSVNNQFLAYFQMKMRDIPISPVNTCKKWNDMGRSVKAGSKGIYMWVPTGFSKWEKDEETGETKKVYVSTGFKFIKKWFAMSQTVGEDITLSYELPNFDFNKLYNDFEIELIDFDMVNGNIQGYAIPSEKKLAINPIAEHPQMTILHEVAHILLKHHENKYSNDLQELEAESVAYICGSVLGVNENDLKNSRGYVQNWFKGNVILEKHAKNIMNVAEKILKSGLNK